MKYKHYNNCVLAEFGPLKYRRVDQISILNGPFSVVYKRVGRHFVLQIAGRTVLKWPLTHKLKYYFDHPFGLIVSMVVVSLDYVCIAVLATIAKLLGAV